MLADLAAYRFRRGWAQKGVAIDPRAMIHQEPGTSLDIGEGTVIAPFALLHLQKDPRQPEAGPCSLRIGRNTAVNEFCNIRASGGEISIGNDCLIAQFVSIIASNHGTSPAMPMRLQPWDRAKHSVTIGDDVWIGANAVILPGANIGRGCVIGAGAVVNDDIPDYSFAVGVPARVIRQRR